MNTASRWLFAVGLTVAASGLGVGTPRAQAQEVQVTGPLAGAPAVRKMRIYRDGRFQIQPEFGATLVDEFTRTFFAGVQLGYHFTDWLGIQAFFDYGIPTETNLTKQVKDRGQRTDYNALSLPTPDGFGDQVGKINFLAGVQATFIPLRGKLALFQAAFVDTDFYLFGGVAFAGVSERSNYTGNSCAPETLRESRSSGKFDSVNRACIDTQNQSTSRIALAPTFGAGLSMYFTDYLAMTLEYRAFPFKWNTSGTDEGGLNKDRQLDSAGKFPDGKINDSDRTSQFNQMFKLGFAFYLPAHSKLTK